METSTRVTLIYKNPRNAPFYSSSCDVSAVPNLSMLPINCNKSCRFLSLYLLNWYPSVPPTTPNATCSQGSLSYRWKKNKQKIKRKWVLQARTMARQKCIARWCVALSGRRQHAWHIKGRSFVVVSLCCFQFWWFMVALTNPNHRAKSRQNHPRKKTYDASEEVFALNWNTIAPAHRQKLRRWSHSCWKLKN